MNSNDKLIDVIIKQLDRLEEKQEEVYRKLTAIEERTKATQEDIEETKDKVKELEEMKDEFYKYKNIIIAVGCGLSSLVSFLVSVFDFKNFFK